MGSNNKEFKVFIYHENCTERCVEHCNEEGWMVEGDDGHFYHDAISIQKGNKNIQVETKEFSRIMITSQSNINYYSNLVFVIG